MRNSERYHRLFVRAAYTALAACTVETVEGGRVIPITGVCFIHHRHLQGACRAATKSSISACTAFVPCSTPIPTRNSIFSDINANARFLDINVKKSKSSEDINFYNVTGSIPSHLIGSRQHYKVSHNIPI